ncbi:hypothetical protein [uncultured Clostridium sp.]|uniref:hypothetical protein n=1 Tax=uncultured Clostridium sp. TaxID=59620 RepID=UPI002731D087|nr:hypothetical protein [uncultured Clostridium sp.]
MYLLCKDKIEKVGSTINNIGLMYSDFESALPYYKENGILISDSLEIQEFNDIMEFLYLGRKEKLEKVSKEENPYFKLYFLDKI